MRWAGALVALVVPALAIGVSGLLWRSILGGQVASHWSDLGGADDTLPASIVFAATLSVAVASTVCGVVLVLLPQPSIRVKRAGLFWSGSVGAVAAGGWLVPAGLTVQAGSPDGAVLGGWVVVLAVVFLYGVVPYLIAPAAPEGVIREPATLAAPLRATETGAWVRTITARLFLYCALLLIAIAIVVEVPLVLLGEPAAGTLPLVILVVAAIGLAAFIRVRITVDWRGLRIVSLLLRIPLKRIPLDRIRRADAADLNPGEWGGWGYRILPGRSALILRRGPGMIVTTTDDRQFALTLRDPEVPVRLLNTLRASVEVGTGAGS